MCTLEQAGGVRRGRKEEQVSVCMIVVAGERERERERIGRESALEGCGVNEGE